MSDLEVIGASFARTGNVIKARESSMDKDKAHCMATYSGTIIDI